MGTPGVRAKQNRGNRGGNERVSRVLSSDLTGTPPPAVSALWSIAETPRERTGRHARVFQALSTGSIPVARLRRRAEFALSGLASGAERALAAVATADEIVGTLVAVMSLTGVPRTVSAAPKLGLALGYDVEAALEALDA